MQHATCWQRGRCSNAQPQATAGPSSSTVGPQSCIRRGTRITSNAQTNVTASSSHRISRPHPHAHRSLRRTEWACKASPLPNTAPSGPPPLEGTPHVVIIGGTGRVGSSAAAALIASFPNVKVTVAGRNRANYDAATARRPDLRRAEFKQVDISDAKSIQAALVGADLVIHAAGPFQRSKNHAVLEKAIEAKVPYLDVCDDLEYSERSKEQFADAAKAAGVPVLISAGIYPGTSNVMAAHIISISRKEYDEEWQLKDSPAPGGVQPERLRYSYYTAGSGGAGPAILETSLLLAGEEAIVYKDGQQFKLPPVSNRREVDFGTGVGRKGLYVYNLPEVQSAYKYLGVKAASARFGTDPFFWNWAMWLVARIVPRGLLADRGFVKGFAKLADPLVRATDKMTGETVAMKVEIDFEKEKNASGIFVHKCLGDSVGYSVAGFAQAMLRGQTAPGVWYPEEKPALADRRQFLRFASTGCTRFDLNKPSWSFESDVQQFIGMIYW